MTRFASSADIQQPEDDTAPCKAGNIDELIAALAFVVSIALVGQHGAARARPSP